MSICRDHCEEVLSVILAFLQGDPNVPAGQLTLEINLGWPVVLPDLEQQRNIEELSRLVLGVHEEVQREAEQQANDPKEGACGREGAEEDEVEADRGACPGDCQPGPSTSAHHHDDQPFVLPLGVTARNEVYPRTCRKW